MKIVPNNDHKWVSWGENISLPYGSIRRFVFYPLVYSGRFKKPGELKRNIVSSILETLWQVCGKRINICVRAIYRLGGNAV